MEDWTNEIRWNVIAYGAVAACALATLIGLYLGAPSLRRRWLPLPRLRPVAWTGHEVFLVVCVFIGFQELIPVVLFQTGFFNSLIGPMPDVAAPEAEKSAYLARCFVIANPLTLAAILGIIFALMFARAGARPHRYGLTWNRGPANVALGMVAFVAARPIVIGIFAVAVLIFPQKPIPPPLTGWEWGFFAFQTIAMAPLLEEIVCRGVVQGWLGRASLRGHFTFVFMTLFLAVTRSVNASTGDGGALAQQALRFAPLIFALLLAAWYWWALARLQRRFDLTEEEFREWRTIPRSVSLATMSPASEEEGRAQRRQTREDDERRARQWADANANAAILGSAMFFAVLHADWPAPFALLPMALLLGWMYRRTQSLLGPIVFHALFNLTTFIAFYGSVVSPAEQKGNAQTTAAAPSLAATSTPASQPPRRK